MKVVVKNMSTPFTSVAMVVAVENAAKAVNGDEKVAILVANELVKVTQPTSPAEEPAEEVVEEAAEEATAEAADEPAEAAAKAKAAEEAGVAAAE